MALDVQETKIPSKRMVAEEKEYLKHVLTTGSSVHINESFNTTINEDDSNCVHNEPALATVQKSSQPPASSRPTLLQIKIIVLGSFGYISFGMLISWPNTLTSHLMTTNTTFLGSQLHLSDSQLDWTGSITYISAIPFLVPTGWLVARVGRRISIIIACLPFSLTWLILAFAFNVEMILLGRCMAGATMALLMVGMRSYMSEIATTNIRGLVISSLDLMKGVGYMVMAGLGVVLPWYHIAFVNAGMVCVFCSFFIFIFPESPSFLAIKQKEDEARLVLRRLRSSWDEVDKEMEQIKHYNERKDRTSGWAALLKWDIIKRIATMFGLVFISSFSGTEVLKVNLTRMMRASGLILDTDLSSLVAMSMVVLGSIAMTGLVDRLGRRRIIIYSLLMMTTAYSVLAIMNHLAPPSLHVHLQPLTPSPNIKSHVMYQSNLSSTPSSVWTWVPVVCFLVLTFSINFGINSVSLVMIVEYFPTNCRSEALSVCVTCATLMGFLSIQLYSIMVKVLTQSGLYWCYAAVSLLGTVYMRMVIEETNQQYVG